MTTSNAELSEKTWLSTTEAAEYIGMSREFLEKHIASGRFPGKTRVGGRWMFNRAEIDKRLAGGQLLYPKAA